MSPELAAALTDACDHLEESFPAFEHLQRVAYGEADTEVERDFVQLLAAAPFIVATASAALRGCVADAQPDGPPAHNDHTTGGG